MKNDILDRIDRFNKGEDIKFRIGVDQDWVLAKLTEKWVDYYNTIFNDNLDIKNIKTWNIIDFIKPEARDFMLNILNIHKFYRNLNVTTDSQRVLEKLKNEGHEIFIVTDPYTRMSFKSKYDWLQENFPFIDKRNYIFTGNKSSIGIDFLIDDGLHNCKSFQGIPLLYTAPYNEEDDSFVRVKNWQDIEHLFDTKLNKILEFYKGDNNEQ